MARLKLSVCVLVVAAASILAAPSVDAQFSKRSTTIQKQQWTDDEINKEINRYEFSPSGFWQKEDSDKPNFVILSGFLKVGKYWQDLDNPAKGKADIAFARRDQLVEGYRTARLVKISVLAKLIMLIEIERLGDWRCGVRYGCYPKGFVVGLGPVDSETAALICDRQRRNQGFCHIYRR